MEQLALGRYRLLSVIGTGGMGTVYKAHDTVIGRDVAIKVLPSELGTLPGYRERFRREAHIAARLTEPHIIPIHDTGEIDSQLYLVMPIIEGIDVGGLLQRDGPMSPERAVHIIEQLAGALDAAHAAGLVHRDIKPSNALVNARDFVYLIDFGIAHDTTASSLTSTGMIVGTSAYMAPERFTAGIADARSDIYSLSCVLYECLTGQRPFPGQALEQQIAAHLTLDPPKVSAQRADLGTSFDDVVARGMAKDPEQRYQSAYDLAFAARHAAVNPTSHTAPTMAGFTRSTTGPNPLSYQSPHPGAPAAAVPWRPPARSTAGRGRVVVPAALAVLLLVAIGFALVQLLRPEPQPSTAAPQWQPYVDDAKQFAVDMVAVSPQTAASDVQRILDGSIGEFHDEFAKKRSAFEQEVIDANKTMRASVKGAGLESINGTTAEVLVAVTAKSTGNAASASEVPRDLRLRLRVEKIGSTYKVSEGEFVP